MTDNNTTPEITHPDWCQRDRCVTTDDGSVIHGHLIGTFATDSTEMEATVERIDTPTDGKVKQGSERAYLHITRPGVLSVADLDRVGRLMGKAATFSGQRNGRWF